MASKPKPRKTTAAKPRSKPVHHSHKPRQTVEIDRTEPRPAAVADARFHRGLAGALAREQPPEAVFGRTATEIADAGVSLSAPSPIDDALQQQREALDKAHARLDELTGRLSAVLIPIPIEAGNGSRASGCSPLHDILLNHADQTRDLGARIDTLINCLSL